MTKPGKSRKRLPSSWEEVEKKALLHARENEAAALQDEFHPEDGLEEDSTTQSSKQNNSASKIQQKQSTT